MIFLLKYWREALLVAVTLFLIGMCQARDRALVREGEAKQRVHIADSTLAVLRLEKKKIDSVWVHDTTKFVQTRDRLVAFHDTINIHDTTQVKVFVEKAAEQVKVCSDLFASCKERADNAEAQLRQYVSKSASVAVAVPRSCTGPSVLWGALGTVGGWLGGRASR